MEQDDAQMVVPSAYSQYSKSNFLIGAKYKSSLLANKILAISLAYSDRLDVGGENESIYSRIEVNELRRILGANGGSFYQQLKKVSSEMTSRSVGMSSEDSKTFKYIAIVISAECKNGVFTIEYNHAMRKYIYELSKNYSKLNLNIMLKFTNNYTFRMYELLRSKAYHRKGSGETGNKYLIGFSLAELKLELGIVNAESDKIKQMLSDKEDPDYEAAVEIAPDRMFDDWRDFKRAVLEKAITEINEKSDMNVEYDPIKKGKGAKVVGVYFTVILSEPEAEVIEAAQQKPLMDEEIDDFVDQMCEDLHGMFKIKDVRTLCKTAEYDKAKIMKAYKCLVDSRTPVENKVGYMVKAISLGYDTKEAAPAGTSSSRASKNSFNDFKQNDYDFDQLEMELIQN